MIAYDSISPVLGPYTPHPFPTSLAFAFEAELGFDTSVGRVVESDRLVYNVRCARVWCWILGTLGRASHVWEVQASKDEHTTLRLLA